MLSHYFFIVKRNIMMKVCIKNMELFKAEKTVPCLALDTHFYIIAVEVILTFGFINLESPVGPSLHSMG